MFLTESVALSLITGLVGYLIGNRLAIDRDKRREFNDLVDPIRRDLFSVRNCPSSSNLRGAYLITFSLICDKLPFWKRRGFDRAVKNYEKSKSDENRNPDGMGGFSYKNTDRIIRAVNDLLKYLKPK